MKTIKRLTAVIAIMGVSAFAFVGCSTEAHAERKGKQAGDQICKVRNADNTDQAQRHLRKAQNYLQDLSRFIGRDINWTRPMSRATCSSLPTTFRRVKTCGSKTSMPSHATCSK